MEKMVLTQIKLEIQMVDVRLNAYSRMGYFSLQQCLNKLNTMAMALRGLDKEQWAVQLVLACEELTDANTIEKKNHVQFRLHELQKDIQTEIDKC